MIRDYQRGDTGLQFRASRLEKDLKAEQGDQESGGELQGGRSKRVQEFDIGTLKYEYITPSGCGKYIY